MFSYSKKIYAGKAFWLHQFWRRRLENKFLFTGEFLLDLLHHGVEVPGLVHKIKVIGAQGEHRAEVKVLDPVLVVGIEQGQVIGGDGRFDFATAFLDALDQHGDRRGKVDEQVRAGQGARDQVEDLAVGAVVALIDVAQGVQRAGKDVGVFVDAAVDDGRPLVAVHLQVLVGAVPQEEDLQVERPVLHAGVEIGQVGVVGDGFIGSAPTHALSDALGERSLAGTDVACDEDEFLGHGTFSLDEIAFLLYGKPHPIPRVIVVKSSLALC